MNTSQLMLQKELHNNGFLGFNSLDEALCVAFGLRNKVMIFLESLVALFGVLSLFIDMYIFSPYIQYYVLMAFLVADYITGVIVGIRIRKEGFSTRKAQRIVFLVLSYSFTMSGGYWLSKAGDGWFFLPHAFFYYLSGVLLLSTTKNLSMLKLLPKGINSFMDKYIDAHKDNISQIIKDSQKESK